MNEKSLRDVLSSGPLLFDGAMGTYARTVAGYPAGPVERACLTAPEAVLAIHRAYIRAGCRAIKTNTFAAHIGQAARDEADQAALVKAGAELALRAAGEEAFVFADIGPAPEEEGAFASYAALADLFLSQGVQNFLFETLPTLTGIPEAAARIKEKCPEALILLSFAVNPDGITRAGESLKALAARADKCPCIDGMGLNCVCGAQHMRQLLSTLPPTQKYLSVMPNAGYPRVQDGRIFYESDPEYYAEQLSVCIAAGARIVGGCCGTTPAYIRAAAAHLSPAAPLFAPAAAPQTAGPGEADSLILRKLLRGEKPILVELDPPRSADTASFLSGAVALCRAGADAITVADCPIGRASMDACLLAAKLKREYGLETLPHMTCRDRNINATKALLLGLSMEGVGNVLAVTGDPVAREERDNVKGVFQFNSRVLARLIQTLTEQGTAKPFFVCGALNVNARNFDAELSKARQKEGCGVRAFLTQPLLSRRAVENLRRAREALSAYLFPGLFPIVSYKNARYLQSEVAGMAVDDDILAAYEGLDRAAGEALAWQLCRRFAQEAWDQADGFYIMTPFQRVGLVTEIISGLKALANERSS